MTSLELRARLENLPQELWDEIFELTFTTLHGTIYVEPRTDGTHRFNSIDPTIKPMPPRFFPPQPHNLLQVSSSTREKFATGYYGNNTFIIRNTGLLMTWVDTIPLKRDVDEDKDEECDCDHVIENSHLTLLRDVRCRALPSDDKSSRDLIAEWSIAGLLARPATKPTGVQLDYAEPIGDGKVPMQEDER